MSTMRWLAIHVRPIGLAISTTADQCRVHTSLNNWARLLQQLGQAMENGTLFGYLQVDHWPGAD